MSRAIKSFKGEFCFLSNFYPWDGKVRIAPDLKLKYEGVTYKTSEHAFQAAKTNSIKTRKHIAKLPTPGQAKRAGRLLPLRPNWEEVKYEIMDLIVWTKFEKKNLKKELLATDPHELIEGNFWHDVTWGVCYCSKCKGKGKNWLGRILMNLRDDFISDLEVEGR